MKNSNVGLYFNVWTLITSCMKLKMLIFVFSSSRKFAHRCDLIFKDERTSKIYMQCKRHRLLFPNKILWKKSENWDSKTNPKKGKGWGHIAKLLQLVDSFLLLTNEKPPYLLWENKLSVEHYFNIKYLKPIYKQEWIAGSAVRQRRRCCTLLSEYRVPTPFPLLSELLTIIVHHPALWNIFVLK